MFSISSKSKIAKVGTPAAPANNEENDPTLDRITELWKAAWEDLCHFSPQSSTLRIEVLNALCNGAGASIVIRSDKNEPNPDLPYLERALRSASGPLQGFRVHQGNLPKLKDASIEIFEAYGRELGSIDKIEQILRDKQIGFREPGENEWAIVQQEMLPLITSTGKKLLHYHAKLRVLQLDIEEDVVVKGLHKATDGWVRPYSVLYPSRSGYKFSSSAI